MRMDFSSHNSFAHIGNRPFSVRSLERGGINRFLTGTTGSGLANAGYPPSEANRKEAGDAKASPARPTNKGYNGQKYVEGNAVKGAVATP